MPSHCAAQPLACSEEPPVAVVVGSGNDGNTTANNETMVTTTTTVGVGEPAEASSSSSGAETEVPDGAPEGEATGSEQSGNRQLQAPKKSGRFIILNADTGNVVYSFDSRSDFTIRKHAFGPLGIARRPAYGNYAGGEGNTNDVVMWGSGSGNDDDGGGETLLFQLPKGFDTTSLASSASLASQFETRVMESVPWTTEIAPTFSKDGLSVYFLISGYRLTGWNKGQAFDIAPNVGPVDVSTANPATGGIQRPMVLTNDDKTLLVGAQDTMYGVDVSNTPASILWQKDTFGPGAAFTTPQITPDGSMAYFGKTGALHAVNLNTEGTLLWADTNGYVDPFTSVSQVTMADFSLDASGQILYYCHGGSDTITALRIGEVVPTEAPTFKPSAAPSVTASMSPSTSMVPTLSMIPTHGSDYIFPSVSPSVTVSDAPSTLPSVKPTVSPTESSYPTTTIIEGGGGEGDDEDVFTFEVSTPNPTASTPENNTATTATNGEGGSTVAIKEDENSSSFPLSMTAIIGIAVGGGVGLILLLASLCYVCRKKPCCKGGSSEDDGVDTDWQSTNEETNRQMQFSSGGGGGGGGGGDNQTPFQYGDEESDVNGGGPLKW